MVGEATETVVYVYGSWRKQYGMLQVSGITTEGGDTVSMADGDSRMECSAGK
jgi:hypothetical protein